MQHADSIIEARWLLPIVPKGVTLENQSVVVDKGRIAAVLPTEEARRLYESERVWSLPDSVVLPGFVNLHSHAPMNLLRGMGADLPLMDWLTKKIWPAEGKLMSASFCREGARLAGLEMAASGVTTSSDMYFFPEDVALGLREAGLRCAVAAFIIGFPSAWAKDEAEYLKRMEEVLEKHQGDPFVRVTVGPHAPYTVGDKGLCAARALAEKYDAPIHMHVHETSAEVEESLRRHGVRPLARLERLGLVTDRLIAVHSVRLTDEEIEQLARAHASVCHCPSSNLKLASGFSPIAKCMAAGINVGIGTDGAASNDKLDMLGETRLAALLAKAVAGDTTAARVHDMLEAATLGGARALHWDKEIGSIESGKAADLIAVRLETLNALPVEDPASQLLYAADRSDVTHAWVGGSLIMRRGETGPTFAAPAEAPADVARRWQARLRGAEPLH